jgi:PAS domain S-box-containing protein
LVRILVKFILHRVEKMDENFRKPTLSLTNILTPIVVGLLVYGLYLTSLYRYVLFHSLAEMLTIVAAFVVFVLAWKSYRWTNDGYLLLIGFSCFFAALLDIIHTLAYKGMNIFPAEKETLLATSLWIAARYLQSLSLLIAPLFMRRRINPLATMVIYTTATALLLASIFAWGAFPVTYVDGVGLTPFKIISEYVISFILIAAAVFLTFRRRALDPAVFRQLILFNVLLICTELAFTAYVGVYDFANLLGHLFKIAAFSLLYRALVDTAFTRPYDLLFRDLAQQEQALQQEVAARTAELREREARLSGIFNIAADVIIVVDEAQRIQSFSQSAEKTFGYAAAEVIGQPLDLLLPERFVDVHQQHIRDFAASPEVSRVMGNRKEILGRRKDGSEFPAEASISKLRLDDRLTFTVFLRDITERKQAEAQIQRQVETLGALYDLARSLSEANDFETILDLLCRRAVEITHVTFSRLLLLENDDLITRAGFPVRVLNHDLQLGKREPLAAHPDCQHVLEENTPRVLHIESPEGIECASFFLDIAQTLCIIPLTTHERRLGLLVLGEVRNGKREPFTEEKLRLARSIGDQASGALHRALLHEETRRRLQNIQALRAIDQAITGSLDLSLTLLIALEQVARQLNVDAADVLLLDPHTQMLEYAAGRGFRSKAIERSRLRLGEGHAGRAALERRTVNVHNLPEGINEFVRADLLKGEDFDCYHGAPLIAKGQVKGVLAVFQRTHRQLDEEWLSFFETLAGQVAIAVDNASMFDGLQRANTDLVMAYDATIEGWSRALDLRDKETEGHSQRVTNLALDIARALGMNDEQLIHIRRGSLLHDIGKMGVPDSILLKPGKLTDEEWAVMYRHPQFAFDMLAPIAYLRPALDIPYGHHERWDGSGYPRKLKGEQIPLAARIFAVIDVYDALTSDRPYRQAWSKEKTLEHIKGGAGTHFDPQVVEVFLKTVNRV